MVIWSRAPVFVPLCRYPVKPTHATDMPDSHDRQAGADNAYAAVFDAVRRIPAGRVTTYGRIARLIGRPQSLVRRAFATRASGFGGVRCARRFALAHRLRNACQTRHAAHAAAKHRDPDAHVNLVGKRLITTKGTRSCVNNNVLQGRW